MEVLDAGQAWIVYTFAINRPFAFTRVQVGVPIVYTRSLFMELWRSYPLEANEIGPAKAL